MGEGALSAELRVSEPRLSQASAACRDSPLPGLAWAEPECALPECYDPVPEGAAPSTKRRPPKSCIEDSDCCLPGYQYGANGWECAQGNHAVLMRRRVSMLVSGIVEISSHVGVAQATSAWPSAAVLQMSTVSVSFLCKAGGAACTQ